ncbi:MAG: hypothetical protein IT435_05545 [Phycisphaerales bacterium]|nr:hypothetical protein [Phycisphaerales bacterium]
MIAYRLDLCAAAVFAAAGCAAMFVGDSKTADDSTDANNAYNFARGMTGVPIVGRGCKAYNGGGTYSASLSESAGSTSVFTARAPGATFNGGWHGINPVNVREFRWSTGVADFGSPPVTANLNDVDNYGDSDPWEGKSVMARFIYLQDNLMVDTVRAQAMRNNVDVGSAPDTSLLGTTQIKYVDMDCGSGSGFPGMRVRFGTGVDETNKYLVPMGFYFYAHSGGTRLPGLSFGQMGIGGYNSSDILAMLGGGGSPTCTKANARAWLEAMGKPNLFIVDMFTNPAGTEYNDLAAGTLTSTIAAVQAVYDVIAEHCSLYSTGAVTPTVLFLNPHQSQLMTRTVCENRWLAILAACQTRSRACCFDMYGCCSKQPNACTVTITGTPTGGTFKLSLGATESGAIAYNATAAQVETALEAMANISGDGKVVVSGGPGPGTPYVVQLIGTYSRTNELNTTPGSTTRLQTTSIALTGGSSPTATVTLNGPWYLADGTHPSQTSGAYEGGILATAIRAAAADSGIASSAGGANVLGVGF